jgi:hypothetical protein
MQGGIMFLANGGHDHVVNMRPEAVIVGEGVPITRLMACKAVDAAREMFWDYEAACGKEDEEIECLCHPEYTKESVQYQSLTEYRCI